MKPNARKPLTRREFGFLLINQEGKCRNCGTKLDFTKARQVIDEHLTPLKSGGSNDLENRALFCVTCAKDKTRKERPEFAKQDRMNGTTSSQYSRRLKRGGSSIQSRGFQTNKDGPYKQRMNGRTERR